MFGGVGKTGEILHQLCYAVFHTEEILGPEGARNLLGNHPFLVRHSPWSGRALDPEWDQFWFGRELTPFWFVVPSDKLSIQFHGSEAFNGFHGTATGKGHYMVRLSQSPMGGIGVKAEPLHKWFLKKFDALDTGEFGTR
jgi:hypothetical protein